VLAIVERPHALVLERIDGRPLAQKPNLQSLLRCRWPPGAAFGAAFVARACRDVAAALAHLHAHSVCHGDVYAHNVVAAADGRATLLDYGAHCAPLQGRARNLSDHGNGDWRLL
jgi:tRNA A-37 threonylcarbamoyl transferase component Bud32